MITSGAKHGEILEIPVEIVARVRAADGAVLYDDFVVAGRPAALEDVERVELGEGGVGVDTEAERRPPLGVHRLTLGREERRVLLIEDRAGREREACRPSEVGTVSAGQAGALREDAEHLASLGAVSISREGYLEKLAEAVAASGIDVLCVTDHNTINGALALDELLPCRVVVGEEVRTHGGEIIGLFLTKRLHHGMPAHDAARAIRAGTVWVNCYHVVDTTTPFGGFKQSGQGRENGEAALVIYDDLSKQAEAYREISLLLRRPPGREAYPGDVFYLHSRLLERCAKLSDEHGGGSLTGLPIVETKAGDVSAYIPTNVISITDGQIYLEIDLFNAGVRPAINVGISVSRVGGNAQIKAMKQVAGRLRLDLAQYRELEAFAEFGSELDKASQAQLERGARVVEILKQPQYDPMPVERQVMSIWAVTNGYLDDIPLVDCKRFESEFLDYMETRHPEVGRHIVEEKTLPEELQSALKDAIEEFRAQFQPSEEAAAGAGVIGGGPVDELKPDVGWDRIGEEGPDLEAEEPEEPEDQEDFRKRAGPIGKTDVPPPG